VKAVPVLGRRDRFVGRKRMSEESIVKRATIFLLMLAGAVSVGATVRVFVTSSAEPYGLNDRALSCMHSWFNGEEDPPEYGYDCDHFQVISFPPVDYPSGSCGNGTGLVCPGSCGEPFTGGYLWLQFQSEPADAKINGMQIVFAACDIQEPTCLYPTYYLMNSRASGGYKRWDGPLTPDYWHTNPWSGVAVTSHGIQNLNDDEPCNLYHGETHTALLGAIVCNAAGTPHAREFRAEITNINYEQYWLPPPQVRGAFISLFDRGDLNCDGWVNFGDINPFVLILTNPAQWQATYPDCPLATGDIDADGLVDFGDINPFVALLTAQ
jgi:hypothetical protein